MTVLSQKQRMKQHTVVTALQTSNDYTIFLPLWSQCKIMKDQEIHFCHDLADYMLDSTNQSLLSFMIR